MKEQSKLSQQETAAYLKYSALEDSLWPLLVLHILRHATM